MPTSIDELSISIEAKAQDANTAIDRLVGKLDRLSASLGRLNTSNLNTLAMGVNRLGTAMQTMNGVKTADFTRLAKNLERLNLIDVSNLSSISASVNHMATAFNQLGNVSENALSIGEMAKNIAKLGNKSVQTAITNIPQLAVAMRDLLTTLSTAPNVSRNIIDMTNALANLANQGSRVGSASRSIVRGMNNTTTAMNRARKSTTSLATAFGKFYATWFLVIRGAKQFVNAIEGTADYIEAYNYYNVALGKIASDWNQDWDKYGYENAEAYADSFTDRLNASLSKLSGLQIDESQQLLTETGLKNLGLNIQEITQYASQLASVTNSIGQTGEVSLATASALTKLAGDVSSLFNMDYSSVANNIQSVIMGQSRAGYKFGWDTTLATLQKYADEFDLSKPVSEMSQMEKQQLRIIAILDQSRVSWGDLANTINSPSNMLRQFTNNVKEAGMVLGQLFIPVLQKVLPVVNGVVIAIKRLLVSIAQLLGVKLDLDSFGQGYTDLSDGFDDMADSLDGVASSAKKAKAGIRAFDELKVIDLTENGGGAGGVGGGAIDLTDEILKATDEYERVWQEAYDRMANRAQDIADRISDMLEPVRKIFEDFAVGDFFQAGEDTSHLVASIFNFFAEAIDRVDWYGIGKKIGDFLAGIDWFEVFKAAGNLMWQGLKAAFELFIGMFDAAPLETAVISLAALPNILKIITGTKIVKGVFNIGKSITVLKDSFWALKTGLKDKNFWSGLTLSIENIRKNLTPLQKFSIGALGTAAEFALVKNGFEGIASGADNLVVALGEIAGGVTVAAAALKLIGLSNPFTAVIVGVTALIGAIKGVDEAAKKAKEELAEAKELEIFGENIDETMNRLNESAESTIEKANAALNYVQTSGLAEAQLAQDLTDRYFELAEQESLTNAESDEMRRIAERLVELEPDLNQYYDERTGLLNANKQAIEDIISAKLKEIQLNAAEEQLTSLYQERITALDNLSEAADLATQAQQEMTRLQAEYNEAAKRKDALLTYQQISSLIMDGVESLEQMSNSQELINQLTALGLNPTEDLVNLHQQLYDLAKGTSDELPSVIGLNEELAKTEYEMDAFAESYQNKINELALQEEAYNSVEASIAQLSEIMRKGMLETGNSLDDSLAAGVLEKVDIVKDANEQLANSGIDTLEAAIGNKPYELGTKVGAGFKNGMLSMKKPLSDAANELSSIVSETFKKALDIHSPSRVMFALGDYTMEGFQLGMENLYQPILSSMKNFGKDIQLAPVPTIKSMYGNLGYSQINNYSEPNYEPLSGMVSNYNQSNAETNALLRELLAAVRQGQKIEVNGRELGRTVRSEASEYFRMTGKPYFAF